MLRTLVRNAASSWMGFAVQAAVAFFLTPFVLHSLGNTRYGIWALVMGLTGYYGLIDLGFRSGITQYMTRHLAGGDFAKLNRTASTAFVGLTACGSVIVLVTLLLTWIAPVAFDVPPESLHEMRWCLLIIGVSVGVQFPFFLFSAVFTAKQRYDLSSAINIVLCLVTAAATFAALKLGYGLIGVTVANAGGQLLSYGVRWRLAYRILPELSISPRLANRQSFWPITSYGIWSVLNQGARRLISYSDTLVIAIFMPVAAIAPFAVAVGIAQRFFQFYGHISIVSFPAITHLDARGETDNLRRMYLAGSKMLLLLSMAGGMIAAIWATDFFRLWVGASFVEGGEYESVATLFHILLAATVAAAAQGIGVQVFLGTRRIKLLAFLLGCEALVNLLLSVYLVQTYGLTGIALGTLIPAVLFQVFLHPIVLCRTLRIPGRTYLREVYLRPALFAVVLLALLAALRYSTPTVSGWGELVLLGLVASLAALVPLALIGLDRRERQRFVIQRLSRVAQALGFRKPLQSAQEKQKSVDSADSAVDKQEL